MKAMVYENYGPPEVLEVRELDVPTLAPSEVLVRVMASALNPYDRHLMRGDPFLVRLAKGLRRPRRVTVPGADLAGIVQRVGPAVTQFRAGDEAFALVLGGGLAEYAIVAADRLAPKPRNLTWEQAAAVPVAGLAALQALRDLGRIESGHRVLVNGASGGIGSFAVQLAKWFGAEVTGVYSTRNAALVQSMGADHVIDYSAHDFTTGSNRYDLILDTVGNRPLLECRRVLTPKGTFVTVGGGGGRFLGQAGQQLRTAMLSPFVHQRMVSLSLAASAEDLRFLGELIENGDVTPLIDRVFPFEETAQAMRYLESGHAKGKTVVMVGG